MGTKYGNGVMVIQIPVTTELHDALIARKGNRKWSDFFIEEVLDEK